MVAVFQGHSHRNDSQDIGGIHNTTLGAMVVGAGEEDNGYSILEIRGDGLLRLSGFRRQGSYVFRGDEPSRLTPVAPRASMTLR